MFQWYAGAALCYVYLSDVAYLPNAPEDEVKSSLAVSRWASRGWTLQELLAPPSVVFYSSDWQVCGTRSNPSAILAEITRIDEPYLNGRRLDDASIAQRMSWAASRATSREEDQAYCLLGIFNVNMPLIYGERSKAFRRLQETISREYPEDHSLYAWGEVVSRFPYEITDVDQIWGSKPIENDPCLSEQQLYGLFADSPIDFMHSGQIVHAPLANRYFDHTYKSRSPAFSFGHTTHVELPVAQILSWVPFYFKNSPIVQLRRIGYHVLLCGRWNETRTEFHYILIPQIGNLSTLCRTREIVARTLETTLTDLVNAATRHAFKPPPQYFPQRGGILFRKVITSVVGNTRTHIHQDVVTSSLFDALEIPGSTWGTLRSILFKLDTMHCLLLFIRRLSPLDGRDDDGGKKGELTFGLAPIKITSHDASPPGTPGIPNAATGQRDETTTKPKEESFIESSVGVNYFWMYPQNIPYQHEMDVPRDEWRLNLPGYANVYMAVERIYLEDDEDIGEQSFNRFIDVVDVVIRVKGDPGYEDEDSENSIVEGGENAAERIENEENKDEGDEDEERGCGESGDGSKDDKGTTNSED
ncbi:hypothetical protein F4803DRAFT_562814 [Xylaria telfairii]|nr:hypothetical protein F4803DRAFT_562814 [Xylaria telfairii]